MTKGWIIINITLHRTNIEQHEPTKVKCEIRHRVKLQDMEILLDTIMRK